MRAKIIRKSMQKAVPKRGVQINIPDHVTAVAPSIVAVIATHNRPQLLARRSLASIADQTRPPDMLIVVDDSDLGIRRFNKAVVAKFNAVGTKTVYLENRRTPGASGAWNTALVHLQSIAPSTFVAILDDDDSWEPEYLHQCEKAVSERGLDMTASGIIYHESTTLKGRLLDPPDRLVAKDLLIRNTNIQGSNIFVRLRKLLEAGGFDEALVSTTDRDICIRLADLKTVRYCALAGHLVHHYAENDRPRLSTPGAGVKRDGLDYFFRKHQGRMSEAEKSAFIRRSRRLFGCAPSEGPPVLPPVAQTPAFCSTEDVLDLVVGAITSPDVTQVINLVNSLVHKINSRSDVTLKVILLENGGHGITVRDALRKAVDQAFRQGLDITLKTLEQQVADAVDWELVSDRRQLTGQKSIAMSRTMLQHYLFLEASPRAAAVVWILDDDIVLESVGYGPDGSVGICDVDYVSGIKQLKNAGISVALCQETGDPPLPALSCIRTQLVDLYHNLFRIAVLRPADPYLSLQNENRISRRTRRDYYYDLSGTETDHLEMPFWYEAGSDDPSVGRVFSEMVSRLPGILNGVQVFRPLVCTEPDQRVPATASINRGPATLIFDVQALQNFPNIIPAINGTDARRSDMVWSLLNHFVGRYNIIRVPLPVRQVREEVVNFNPNFDSLLQDIRGYAFYSSLQDALASKAQQHRQEQKEPHGTDLLYFDEHEIKGMVDSYRKYICERAHAFELNFIRIMGLLSSLRRFCQPNPTCEPTPWWLQLQAYAAPAAELRKFVEILDSVYTDTQLDNFRQQIANIDVGAVSRFLRNLPQTVNRHRASMRQPADALHRSADAYVRSEFATGPLTCLGIGGEGVALTDGHLVYKCFHHYNPQDRRIAFLRSLAGKLSGYRALPALQEVRCRGDRVIAVYPYEAGTRYTGGHLDGLLTLLRDCRRAGIACRNIHPDNLLVTPSGLRFIDYGADVVPANDPEFEQMCRRAFLTYRFTLRPDLKRLMTRALSDATLAELTGMEQFRNVLDPRGLDDLFYQPMMQLIAERQPQSVLDYGCGDGRLAERLVRKGIKVAGYDIDPATIEKCLSRGSQVTYGGTELRARLLAESSRFDAVVCSLVLCTVADNLEFEAVLRDLRQLVTNSGEIFVSVCNPFYITALSTELAEKHLPEDFQYDGTFLYAKTMAVNGNRRMDVHRSCAAYLRAFGRSGLLIREVREFDGTDTRSILPASEHLVFRLSPAPLGGPRVSLLIKTCLMEWRTIERLVRHQVGQLENPSGFAEKVVVVDTSEGPFQHQYDQPDLDAHRAAMERLLQDGVVDRVVYASTDPKIIRSTYRKWFGIESVETHSVNGQQLFATLFGFDSCTGDYVLQLDSDLMIVRADRDHDYLTEMADVLRCDRKALFVSMNICRAETVPYTAQGPDGNWRVEVRGCLYDRQRLQSVLPVSNELEDGRFTLAWHRAFDQFIDGSYHSYRGGSHKAAFIHVPNNCKTEVDEWLDIVGSVERGYIPEMQMGKVELVGSAKDWAGPLRSEPFVFVICGRNVSHGRFKRCFQSLASQQGVKWGAVVVDDASTNGFGDYAEMLLADYADRVTLIRNERRRGALYNTWSAVTRVCTDPETVVITLDADDALVGSHVLERVRAEYDDGADATVGSMLRLDKEASYPVSFDNPRCWTGNVWQHLRTFKKSLFDAIDIGNFKIDGEWIDRATDWAFMVPIIEMATSPRFIPDRLYLYEPAVPKDESDRQERKHVIEHILSKTPGGVAKTPGEKNTRQSVPS